MNASHATGSKPPNSSAHSSTLPGSGTAGDQLEGHKPEAAEHGHGLEWTNVARIAFLALAAVAVWFRIWEPFPHISVIGIVATLIGGYPIFREAFENIVERKMTMELSMTIALLAALAIGRRLSVRHHGPP